MQESCDVAVVMMMSDVTSQNKIRSSIEPALFVCVAKQTNVLYRTRAPKAAAVGWLMALACLCCSVCESAVRARRLFILAVGGLWACVGDHSILPCSHHHPSSPWGVLGIVVPGWQQQLLPCCSCLVAAHRQRCLSLVARALSQPVEFEPVVDAARTPFAQCTRPCHKRCKPASTAATSSQVMPLIITVCGASAQQANCRVDT